MRISLKSIKLNELCTYVRLEMPEIPGKVMLGWVIENGQTWILHEGRMAGSQGLAGRPSWSSGPYLTAQAGERAESPWFLSAGMRCAGPLGVTCKLMVLSAETQCSLNTSCFQCLAK